MRRIKRNFLPRHARRALAAPLQTSVEPDNRGVRFAKLLSDRLSRRVTLSPLCLDDVDAHLAGGTNSWCVGLAVCPRQASKRTSALRAMGDRRAAALFRHQDGCRNNSGTIDLRLRAGRAGQRCYGLYPSWRGRGLATRAIDPGVPVSRTRRDRAVIKVETEDSIGEEWRCGRLCSCGGSVSRTEPSSTGTNVS